jgi:hypothetical protein
MKVRIKKLPQARTGYQVRGSLANDVPAFGGADYNAYIGQPDTRVSKTISKVKREDANLEAEGGETVVGNLDGSMMPSFKTIKGPRHSSGGVPLALPDDSFIFSDTASMKINDPSLLKMFNKPTKKGGYTPAELSKPYQINDYRKILQDPESDKVSKKTAEMMIKNYTLKLGALALAQESHKGFPQGIPLISRPYMKANGIEEDVLLPKPQEQEAMASMPQAPQQMPDQEQPMVAYGGSMGGYDMPFANGGSLQQYQDKGEVKAEAPKLTPEQEKEVKVKWNGDVAGYLKYKQTENAIKNNPEFRKKLYEQYKKTIANKENYTGSKKENWESALKDRTEEEVINGLLEQEQRNLRLKAFGLDASKTEQGKVKGSNTNASAKKLIEENKEGLGDLDFTRGHIGQAAYIAYDDLINGEKPKGYDRNQTGKDDELKGRPRISGIDNANTNTTLGEFISTLPGAESPAPSVLPVIKKQEEKQPDPYVQEDVNLKPDVPRDPQWWLQDTVNTMGAFGDRFRRKKAMPFEPRVDFEEPRPTFIDPTRTIAAQSEQANIASQAVGQFAGAQGVNARLAQIQGQAGKQAADTLSNVNNQNVGIANQFEQAQSNIRNQETQANAQMATRVYDKNVIANQQFANTQQADRDKARQSYTNALTNRAKTDALNQMYPNYQVDPTTGGLVNYTPTEKQLDNTPDKDIIAFANEITGFSPEVQKILLKNKFGKKGGEFAKGGAYVMGSNVFPFMFA